MADDSSSFLDALRRLKERAGRTVESAKEGLDSAYQGAKDAIVPEGVSPHAYRHLRNWLDIGKTAAERAREAAGPPPDDMKDYDPEQYSMRPGDPRDRPDIEAIHRMFRDIQKLEPSLTRPSIKVY
ncbi:MAG TPA: hypothetical protein VEA16_08870 [Vicinamibacterales bacterium]|nr:hypothetical protein [Vicinamibacterales bacterium]